MTAVALTVPNVAVIVAAPFATAVTRPVALTVAAAAFELAHVNVTPGTTTPLASFASATSCVVAPRDPSDAVAGVTVDVAGGGCVTVTVPVPLMPIAVAVTVVVPMATPVSRPDELTVAVLACEDVHVTAGAGAQFVPLAVPVSCTVRSRSTETVVGETATAVTTHGGAAGSAHASRRTTVTNTAAVRMSFILLSSGRATLGGALRRVPGGALWECYGRKNSIAGCHW